MRWEDERYVRLYTRDTPEFLALSWYARGLFALILRKVDRAGIMQVGKLGLRGVAVAVGGPWTEVEAPLRELLDDGCVVFDEARASVLLPNFLAAQEAAQSDVARKRASRERARAMFGQPVADEQRGDTLQGDGATRARLEERAAREADAIVTNRDNSGSQYVTELGHAPSRGVTNGHAESLRSDPIQADLSLTDLPPPTPPPSGGDPGAGGASVEKPGPGKRQRRPAGASGDGAAPTGGKRRGPTDSDRRYAKAYADGMRAACGEDFPPPLDPADRRVFGQVLPVYAKDRGGAPLVGDELDAWICRSAELYRRATAHQPALESGFRVDKWGAWVRGGGMQTPCAKLGFFGGDVMELWGRAYSADPRYGSYAPGAHDARDASDIAMELCSKIAGYAREHELKLRPAQDLTHKNMTFWAERYLALDGYNGGRQYAEQRHPIAGLKRNAASFGMTWAPATGPVARRAPPRARPQVQRGGITIDEINRINAAKNVKLAKELGLVAKDGVEE